MRNSAHVLDRYMQQIKSSIQLVNDKSINWYISIYENDSTDGTPNKLSQLDLSMFTDYSVVSEKLQTVYYSSVVAEERVKNLSNARNKAVTAKNMHMYADYVLWIEPDVFYSYTLIPALLAFNTKGLKSVDVFSGINIASGESRAYDTWATRRTPNEEWGDRYPDWFDHPVAPFYSTFNGVCLYNADPFKKGIRFGYINPRSNRFDCDTVVICENFRQAGYNNIFVDQSLNCYHD